MAVRVLTKQLAGAEDLLLGKGSVSQTRNGVSYTINKLNLTHTVDDFTELRAIDYTKINAVFVNGKGIFYLLPTAAIGTYIDDNGSTIVPDGTEGTVAYYKETTFISVGMFGADATGTLDAVPAFQAAIDATPNSGYQRIRVETGTYLGDMTTLDWGARSVVIFVEDFGSVTYSTADPYIRERAGLLGTHTVDVKTTPAGITPMCFRANMVVRANGVSGLAWAVGGVASSESGATRNCVGVYGQANAAQGSQSSSWGGVFEAGDSRSDNATYGTTYPSAPIITQAPHNAVELDSVHTGQYSEQSEWSVGAQIIAYGGSESTNAVTIHAGANNRSHSHDGTAQAGAASAITLAATADSRASYYVNSLVTIIAGTGIGQEKKIVTYNGATKEAVVDSPWTTQPDNTSVYVVFDVYKSGMWRRGINIHSQSINDIDGIAIDVNSDYGYGLRLAGNSNYYDIIIDRDMANMANVKVRTGNVSGAMFTANFNAGDSASAVSDVEYGRLLWHINDNTAGAHYGEFRIAPAVNGAVSAGYYFRVGEGVYLGNATGGFKGIGTINLEAGYYTEGSKVVGVRKTGWGLATGTATRTTFDTATVTTAQLAERVKALIDDLDSTAGHGLIGAV